MENKKVRINTFPKFLMTVILFHAIILTTASYILAWFGRDPVVSVSAIIVQEILAPTAVYFITNVFANIFEKNKTSISTPLDYLREQDKSVG